MASFPTDRYGLIRRSATLRLGINDDVIAAAVKRGELIRLAPGVCAVSVDESSPEEPAERIYRLRSIAVATSARDQDASALSHDSAAAVHALPLLHPERRVVHLTKVTEVGGFGHGLRVVHAGPVRPDDLVDLDGLRVTSLERTAVDVAMGGDFAQALVVFDHALVAGADAATMTELLDSRTRWRGAGIARRALSYADAASESVGESWSRAQIIEAGFPVPRLQHTFQTADGVARTDFDWDAILVGEFDGLQ